jgi:DNA repair protein RadC
VKIQPFKCRLVKDGPAIEVGNVRAASGPRASERLFRKLFDGLPHEEMWILLVNVKHEAIGTARVSMGGAHGCAVKPSDVFRPAVVAAAAAVILAHNHPSGDFTPSEADEEFTRRAIEAGEMMGITLLDHLIFTPSGDWISMQSSTDVWHQKGRR